jgi:hypothetical protein
MRGHKLLDELGVDGQGCRSIVSTACCSFPSCFGSGGRRATERIRLSFRSASPTKSSPRSLLTWPPSKSASGARRFEFESMIIFREFFCSAQALSVVCKSAFGRYLQATRSLLPEIFGVSLVHGVRATRTTLYCEHGMVSEAPISTRYPLGQVNVRRIERRPRMARQLLRAIPNVGDDRGEALSH